MRKKKSFTRRHCLHALTPCNTHGTITTTTLTLPPPLLRHRQGRDGPPRRLPPPANRHDQPHPASSPEAASSSPCCNQQQQQHSAIMDDHFERMLEPSRYVRVHACAVLLLLLSPCVCLPSLFSSLPNSITFLPSITPPPLFLHPGLTTLLLSNTARPSPRIS